MRRVTAATHSIACFDPKRTFGALCKGRVARFVGGAQA